MDWRARSQGIPVSTVRHRSSSGDWSLRLVMGQLLLCAVLLLGLFGVRLLRPNWMPQVRYAYSQLASPATETAALPDSPLVDWAAAMMERIEVPADLRDRVLALLRQENSITEEMPQEQSLREEAPAKLDAQTEAKTADLDKVEAAQAVDTGGAGGLLFWGEQEVPASCTLSPLWLILPLEKPVKEGKITSVFGWRSHPITQKPDFHRGVDFAAPLGTPIHAAKSGTVVEVGKSKVYGNFVTLSHSGGLFTTYAHCHTISVEEGQWVAQGTKIAAVGSTGISSGAHLHFETSRDGLYYDPLTAMK